jgi:endonuclease/exonuclease/phosphatase family metal-dependent hydrolase
MLASALFLICALAEGDLAATRTTQLTVMSFNLRYASEEGENRWSARRRAVATTIREANPDVIGTQEGLYPQLEQLTDDLPEYAYVGLGRRGGSKDEFCAILYRRARFEVTEFDHFWLSEKPAEIGSLAYDAELPRMVTWARLRERATGAECFVVNTHFDHAHEVSRRRSADQLAQFVSSLETKAPVIVTGDFNAPAESSEPWRTLTATGLADSFVVAGFEDASHGTFHGFRGDASERGRIDWILFKGAVTPREPKILRTRPDGVWPSDHFPVVVQFETRE